MTAYRHSVVRPKRGYRGQVQVSDALTGVGYTPGAELERAFGVGKRGHVVDDSDSHGLCFKVNLSGGASAWYDAEELGVLR